MASPLDIVYEKVHLKNTEQLAFVLHNVYTSKECQAFINTTEKAGYEIALLNTGGSSQALNTDIRNSSRHIWDSTEEASKLWKRIETYIPKEFKGRKVLGLNERLRFLRYDAGEYFKPHMDGRYMRDNGEVSLITVHLYLNEGFEGGNTTFFNYGNENDTEGVVPKTGSVLIFQHDIVHEGSTLVKGRKYTVRTDVMYSADRC